MATTNSWSVAAPQHLGWGGQDAKIVFEAHSGEKAFCGLLPRSI